MRDPTAADWLEQFAGDYDNSALGRLSIRRKADSIWAEFPNFALELGMDVREATRLLALVSPPFSGSASLRPAADRAALVLEGGQEEYVFRRL
jgi:hypothetical protein